MKRQALHIAFQPHALERMQTRTPGMRVEQLRGRLRHRIEAELRKGAQVHFGAIRVEVTPDIWCVCAPGLVGWVVITVIDRSIPKEDEQA